MIILYLTQYFPLEDDMSKSGLQLVENELIEAREDDNSPW